MAPKTASTFTSVKVAKKVRFQADRRRLAARKSGNNLDNMVDDGKVKKQRYRKRKRGTFSLKLILSSSPSCHIVMGDKKKKKQQRRKKRKNTFIYTNREVYTRGNSIRVTFTLAPL